MARKQKHEEHENHERWLVSYADFITLLFAFFVVMYSISSVNEGKYRVLSDAIVAAFRSQEKSIRPIQVGQPTRAPKSTQMEVQKSPGIVKSPNPPIQLLDQVIDEMKTSGKLTREERKMLELIKKIGGISALEKLRGLANLEGLDELLDKAGLGGPEQQKLLSDQEILAIKGGLQRLADLGGLEGLEKLAELGGLQGLEELAKVGGLEGLEKLISAAGSEGAKAMTKIADDIEQAMSSLIQEDLITIERNDQWIEVEINTSILYPSGSAHLQPKAVPVLKELARILRDFPNPMRIEGFTDNVPINTLVYPSNWELSSARASRVVRLFTSEGIAPERMAAIGYGEYRPIASNDTAEGRSKNRRVVLVVLANHDVEDLFNSGVLKSGERTGGFRLPGAQPDVIDEISVQPPKQDDSKENITPAPPRQAPSAVQEPQEAAKTEQPVLPEPTPLPEQLPARPAIVQEPLSEVPVQQAEPVIEQPTASPREPVIFPSRSSAPNVTKPVIDIPSPAPLLLPPIKFIPPISEPIEGQVMGNTITPRESSAAITVRPRQKASSTIQTPPKVPEIQQSAPPESAASPTQTAGTQETTPAEPVEKAESAVEQSVTSNREPVTFPSQSGAPNIMNGTAPVLLPPIKFVPPISRPIEGVVIGKPVNPETK